MRLWIKTAHRPIKIISRCKGYSSFISEVTQGVMEEMLLQLDCSIAAPNKASPFERTCTSRCQKPTLN